MTWRGGGSGRGNHRGKTRGQGRGIGRKRDDRGGHEQAAGVCFDFQNGACNRKNCRFSHDTDAANSGAQRRVGAEETEEQQHARTQYNSWKKYLGQAYSPTDTYNMQRVWEGALGIIHEDDRDWKQQLPRDLDNDETKCNGRSHVKAIIDRRAKPSDTEEYVGVVKNFLEVITHTSLVDCLAVDEYVGGIYSFIGDGNGTRAIGFFQHVCETLVAVHTDGGTAVGQIVIERALTRLSAALYELLYRNRRARINDDLDRLVDALESAANIIPASLPSMASTIVKSSIADTRALVNRAKGLVSDDESTEDAPRVSAASLYPRDLVVPANRHNNDKVDIAEITIFPTREELMSDVKEFLPSTDPDQPHFLMNKVERHIDTNFRLYRHDVFGELKKALSGLMRAAIDNSSVLSKSKVHLGDMRVYQYPSARVTYVTFDTRRGLQIQISFPQPPDARRRSPADRRAWWEESRRLEEGSLLSYIWIQDSVVQQLFLTVTQKSTNLEQEYSLVDRNYVAIITAKLTTQDHASLNTLIGASCGNMQGVLLEFPNVIPATFVPILENLQDMQRLSRLRFSQWLLPDRHDGSPHQKVYQEIPPPAYSRQPGFKFPLKEILKTARQATDSTFGIEATASSSDATLLGEIAAKTELDYGQCRALVTALTHELAFIQGPPGTGKSYIGLQVMRILLAIKKSASLGPIIVVCYTNHALDQFLEHLIKIGITKIIRVGGQSKSELLDGHNLRDIAKSEGKTNTEAYKSAMMYKDLEEHENDANKTLGRLHASNKNADWKALRHHISCKYPKIHSQFDKTDKDNFTFVGRWYSFDAWKPAGSVTGYQSQVTTTEIQRIVRKAALSAHTLQTFERSALVQHWLAEIRLDAVAELSQTVDLANNCYTTLSKVHDEADRRVLADADVIGVTTSGLAKRISVLQHVSSKVIICEEAGEVMEPHMLSALLPTVEHCIQIGDHEQLRPTINNFRDLSLESKQGALHSLDKSQFERLSVGELCRPLMPVAQLEVQHRMRPDISTLIRETIYPKLIDHSSTIALPDVVGMRKNVFWLDHDHMEDDKESLVHHSKSRSNEWEIAMVHALVRHIVRQGTYTSTEIAVLTPYTGQLQKLRAALHKDFEIVLSDRDQDALGKDGFGTAYSAPQVPVATQGYRKKPLEKKKLSELLRVATVDNFQGEEAKIIILSLVRSNKDRNVGFLKTSNRINVLLSRAQHGMYLIGNTETYRSVEMWQKVINMLGAEGAVGHALALCCPRHIDKVIEVSEPDDFETASPEGGCREACSDRLDCGHSCQARCHSEAMHAVWQCEMPCQRRHNPMLYAPRNVVASTELAITTASELVMEEVTMAFDSNPARYNASTRGAISNATSLACLALNNVLGPVNIRAAAQFHAQPLAIGFRAIFDARNCFHADTSQCEMRAEEQPDLIMMIPYADLDLNDSPIVVLGCQGRHFFTVETLDGIIGMKDVYEIDEVTGKYTALKDNEQLAASVPQCPTCREPVRQYVAQRYNRVVNRAVIDEMSKRFVVSGQQELQELSGRLQSVEDSLESTRSNILSNTNIRKNAEISNRYVKASDLEKAARAFLSKMDRKHKPSHKLHEAIVHAASKQADLTNLLAQMSLESAATSKKKDPDQRITLGGRLYHLRVRQLILNDKFDILRGFKPQLGATGPDFPGGSPVNGSDSFLHDCSELIKECRNTNSPKLAVEATLYYAHIVRLLGSLSATKQSLSSKAAQYRESAKALLEDAEKLCENAFQGRDQLKEGVEQSLRLLGREFYVEVTKEEIEAIKRAMVGGRGGIASHSGHWYNCVNGHPFAIGECGMPMQLARCPECGEQVGGQRHQAVAGVTRAVNMEE
ncbi:hypothetical protein M3J09_006999 [Ascochyta lentis]